ncbi:MAG: response regulator, partial [Bradyrhizobium sp.]|uniref:response regulator n=1 Tax=Bradyrhizobium sp. TaxID=376 RepID=UPI001D851C5D
MSTVVADASPAAAAGTGSLRVMVVDDAVVVRGLVARWVEAEPDMQLVASLRTGREAVDQLERTNPDVVVLDVEMPDLDGISALPLLLQKKRDLIVIMASTLTRRNAEVSLKALSLGAADYIPKPETSRGVTTSTTFRHDLIDKIRQLGARRARRPSEARPAIAPQPGLRPKIEAPVPTPQAAPIKLRPFPAAAPTSPTAPGTRAPFSVPSAPGTPARAKFSVPDPGRAAPAPPGHGSDIKLRAFSNVPPRVLLIGSSTGGPQALT